MMNADISGWTKLIEKYGQRIKKLRSPNPFGAIAEEKISQALRLALHRQLLMGRHSLKAQQAYFATEGHGMYGPRGTADPKVVNPQEFLGGRDSGGMYRQSYVRRSNEEGTVSFNLSTEATMKPYATELPEGPLAKYLREGWSGRGKAMKPRPFGKWLASSHRTLLGFFQTALLQNIGFRKRT